MAEVDFDIVIVGAGIAGGALACALAGHGLRLALVEANPVVATLPDPDPGVQGFDSRVSAITPASCSLLESIGAWEEVSRQRPGPYQHMHVWDGEGTASIDFSAAELGVSELGTIVENRVLTAALMQRLSALPDVSLFNPARVKDLAGEVPGKRIVELEDGQRLSCSLLVAADGARSGVRTLAGFKTREWDYGHHALVCTVETQLAHQSTAYQRFSSSGPLAFLPLPDSEGRHYCSIVWSLDSDLVEPVQALADEAFGQRLSAAFEHRLGNIQACSTRVAFPLRQRHAIDYVQAGLALVGDAAHTIHPLAGQGINLGLQDVAVLSAEVLRARQAGLDFGSLAVLRRYQRQRKSDNLLMMAAMDGFKHLFGQRTLPLRWLRNAGMRAVASATPLKQQLMRHAMGL